MNPVLTTFWFSLVCVCGGFSKDLPPVKPDLLFLLGGQSNMKGNGFTADLPDTAEFASYRTVLNHVSLWNEKTKAWEPLNLRQRFGPEIGFGHALGKALPGHHIGLIKHAEGGTSMDQWAPAGDIYPRLLGAYREAKKTVPEAKLVAMLWHQGERDSDSEAVANAYKGKLEKHIAAVRKDTGVAELLVIVGQINPGSSFMGRARFSAAAIVREAQANLRVAHAVMIPTDDLEKNAYVRGAAATGPEDRVPGKEDNLHYSAKGQIRLGVRYARAVLEGISGNPTPAAAAIGAVDWSGFSEER
ncbi:MAG: sialate O-acetylesterase [Verrucomicrobiota bacterium JB025]|nr:sialate O-acetylesterase [Verrucomicrobiota bacterium JB025]